MSCYTNVNYDFVEPYVRVLNLYDSFVTSSELRESFPNLEELNVYGLYVVQVCSLELVGIATNCMQDYDIDSLETVTKHWDDSDESDRNMYEKVEDLSAAALSLAVFAIVAVAIGFAYSIRRERTRTGLSRRDRAAINEIALGSLHLRLREADTTSQEALIEDEGQRRDSTRQHVPSSGANKSGEQSRDDTTHPKELLRSQQHGTSQVEAEVHM